MRKLDFLIPIYNEGEEVVKQLLDSIAIQQNVNLKEDVGAIICCDGGTTRLSQEFINSYPFAIEFYVCEHRGVSATRNSCLDKSRAEYVIYADCDDLVYNACGLWIIFREMRGDGFDGMVSVFVEETRDPRTKEVVYINRNNDSTFVHGKVWRRKYLIDNKIRWNDALTIHEDSYFNMLCINLSENVKLCTSPFYLWRWRDDSVCRHDPNYMLKTYRNMLDSNDALVDEFVRRGKEKKATELAGFMIFDAYYTMNKPEWIDQENQEYRYLTERRFGEYFRKHKEQWDSIEKRERMQMSAGVRNRSIMEGMEMEKQTIDEWLAKVEGMA